MKSAIKTSEESWIEQQMLEDKKRATDWEATNEAIEEQVARESYLQWLQDQEKQARQVPHSVLLFYFCFQSLSAVKPAENTQFGPFSVQQRESFTLYLPCGSICKV